MIRMGILIIVIVLATRCSNQESGNPKQGTEQTEMDYIKLGDSLVKLTFDSLRNTLVRTISEQGPGEAIRFCNLNALNLTSSFASNDITVSRVTDQPRNPGNRLSDFDRVRFDHYKKLAERGDSLTAVTVAENNKVHYYKPILVQTMCLTCHGTPGKEMNKQLAAVIDSLYPADKAKGYKEGDLRGMWHVEFGKASK